mmetsp:Transcript_5652/g.10724  ORF Transcript_5652/g.10724 Transcript_5652/m.10724 type:complete len:229 (-) Transcript_5652:1114-1800(-)
MLLLLLLLVLVVVVIVEGVPSACDLPPPPAPPPSSAPLPGSGACNCGDSLVPAIRSRSTPHVLSPAFLAPLSAWILPLSFAPPFLLLLLSFPPPSPLRRQPHIPPPPLPLDPPPLPPRLHRGNNAEQSERPRCRRDRIRTQLLIPFDPPPMRGSVSILGTTRAPSATPSHPDHRPKHLRECGPSGIDAAAFGEMGNRVEGPGRGVGRNRGRSTRPTGHRKPRDRCKRK